MIAIIDYGLGNLRSVEKAFQLYTDKAKVVRRPEEAAGASCVVVPGDGAFATAMKNLESGGWKELVLRHIERGDLLVGICVGYQLLFEQSEEFVDCKGLGLLKGSVRRFSTPGLKVPHMGWNNVHFAHESPFIAGIDDNAWFYFIHTYYPQGVDSRWVLGDVEYGTRFPCIIEKDNIFGTQFHPEKSHNAGLKIVENIVRRACL